MQNALRCAVGLGGGGVAFHTGTIYDQGLGLCKNYEGDIRSDLCKFFQRLQDWGGFEGSMQN